MLAFRLSAKSLEDLKSIGRFTLKYWGREQCEIYLSKLDESFHILAEQPHIGTFYTPYVKKFIMVVISIG